MVTFYRLGASQLIVTQIFAFIFFGFPHGHVNGYDLYEGSPCKLTDGSSGVCTIIDQCVSVYQGLVSNTLPYEEVAKNRCGFVKDKEVVCCKDRQPGPPIGRTTPRVTTPTRSEFSDNVFSEKRDSSGNEEVPSVRRPQVENNILNNRNVENIQDQNSRSGAEENGDKISSRFFLGNLLSGQNRENTFQKPHVQQQPMNVRCIKYKPTTTTPPPVQVGPRIFGIFNFNKPARTTPRPSVLSPLLDAFRPIKEIPLNFISSIGNRRNGINVQGQLNINPGQSATFGDINELCVDNNNGLIQGGPNTNNFIGSDSVNRYQVQNLNQRQNQGIWSNPSSPMSAPFLHANQPEASVQNPNRNPNHNIWNIPNPPVSSPSMSSFSMNGNQLVTPMQNPNLNPNQNMWNIPNSPFAPSNSMNGNQPMEPFQPVPMPNPSLTENQNPYSPTSVHFTDNGFRTTTVKAFIENNQNWDTSENYALEPWMVDVLKTTTSTIRTPKMGDSQLEPWMLDALKDSNNTVSNQPDIRNPKPLTVRPDTKSEPLQMPPSSEFDPWMLEAIKEDSTSTRAPTNPDRPKKDTPIIPSLKNSENTTSFGDSVLDPWMKEALLVDVNSTSTTTLKSQIDRFDNSSSSSNTDKNSGFEPWMLEALRETNLSSSNKSGKDLPNIDSLRNFDIETTTKKSVFGDSVLDPWMKEALINGDESKSMETSTTDTYALEEPPIPTSRESNNGNNTFDSWMLDALQGVTSTIGSVTKVTSQRPPNDTHLDSWMKEAIAGEESSSDRGSDTEGAQSSKRAVDSWRDHFHYNRTRSRDPDNSKSFSNSSNASVVLPFEEEWVWEHKIVANNNSSSQTSNKTMEDDVNYWMNEALKQKTKSKDDKESWNPDSTDSVKSSKSPYIQHNQNSQNNQFGRGNLGVGETIPERNGTDSINFDLFNEIFDIPENRPTKPIGPRTSRRADDACAKYRDDFGAAVTYHILGGIAASLGEFPHMAALGYPSTAANREYDWNCGASLISDQYLLTSAHCITRDGPTIARLGKIAIDTDEDGAIAADYLIAEPIKHPIYTNARQYHDIALVKLNRKVDYTENIRPACLDTNQTPMPANTNVVVTGWGTISLRTRSRSDVLLKANLTTVTLSSCNQSHADYEHNRKLPNGLTEAQMCAFDPELVKDACEGDSGGPLQIVDDSGMSTIYGVTSFGVSCASKIPGVYARVSNYVDWIESIVWP